MNLKYILGAFAVGFGAKLLFGNNSNSSNLSDYDFRTTDLREARSTRNNNPGNVKKPNADTWKGTVGYDEIGHAIFENYIYGTRAMIKDLQNKITNRGLDTIAKILPVYCPVSDGCNVAAYISQVEKYSGINRNARLNAKDKETMYQLCQTMAYYEAGNYKDTNANRTKLNRQIFNLAWELLYKVQGIGRVKKTQFFDVYEVLPNFDKNGKTNLAFTRGKTGVYIIKEDNKIVYVGKSNNDLYRTIIRHFQFWNDSQQPNRITYRTDLGRHNYTIRVVLCKGNKVNNLEKGLILKYNPRDNKQKYEYYYEDTTEVKEAIQEATEVVADAPTYYPPEWDF